MGESLGIICQGLAERPGLLKEWRGRKAGKKRDLLSIIGTLHHASKAVRQGRTFLRRLINLSMAVKHVDNFVRLDISAQSDIQWWWGFAESWNGVSMLLRQDTENPQVIVTSDASGSWGCAWCLLQQLQVSVPMAPRLGDNPHKGKGAHPSDYGGSSLGSRMVRKIGLHSMRQCSSCSHC